MLFIEADFIAKFGDALIYFRYKLTLSKNKIGKYIISYEQLSSKRATSKVDVMETNFEVVTGEVRSIWEKGDKMLSDMILQRTVNLLENTSMCALFYEKILISEVEKNTLKSF